MYHIATKQDVQENLLEEIEAIAEDNDGKINHDTIKSMHYLEACINETLRMNGPVGEHLRACTKDCDVNGMKIKKGTRIRV